MRLTGHLAKTMRLAPTNPEPNRFDPRQTGRLTASNVDLGENLPISYDRRILLTCPEMHSEPYSLASSQSPQLALALGNLVEMDFNVRPVAKICASSGQQLLPGHACWSVLVEQDGRVVRQDYSEESWSGPPDGVIGYWQSRIPDRTSTAATSLDTDSLFDYFLQLCESPNKVEQDYQYVLALLLMRKRRLILEESTTLEDQPAMRLIGTGGEGPFEIIERDLSDDRIVELQTQLFSGSTA
jgi:hypothetical protein